MGVEQVGSDVAPERANLLGFEYVIDDICNLDWRSLNREDLTSVAWVYYYFSIQFRENLEVARGLYPDDDRIFQLDQGERDTDNLSPWPGVALLGERLNHDEFMRRTLSLTPVTESRQRLLEGIGQSYLERVRSTDDVTKALTLASYEDGGLERVFGAILLAQDWGSPLLQAFRHFLTEHIRFDSDPEQGHGSLCRHLTPDQRVRPLWEAFQEMLIEAAPGLAALD